MFLKFFFLKLLGLMVKGFAISGLYEERCMRGVAKKKKKTIMLEIVSDNFCYFFLRVQHLN